MSKKLHSKLLSVVLVIAICCATLCGSLIASNAAAAYYNGTYTFSEGIAAYGAKQASVDLTFDLAAGFAAGDFAVKNDNSYFTDVTVKVKSGTTQDGSAFDASNIVVEFVADESGTYLGYVTFWTDELKYYTSLTLELTYTMSGWVQAGGNKYAVDIADVVLAAESDVDVAVTGSASYIHNHHAWLNDETLDPTTAGDGYHLVYDTTCRICTSQHTIKQVMANYTQVSGATAFDKYPNGNLGISGINVEYNDDGTVNLKIHGYSPYYRSGNYIVVTDTEGKIYDKYELKTNTTSQYAGNVLVENAQVWTLENTSARDIDTELLFTMMYNDNGTVRTSTTVPFSLADYCVNVVGGNAVWTDDATDEQIEADKDVAAALYLYGAKTNDYHNNPVIENDGSDEETSEPVDVEVTPVEKTTAVWDVNNKGFSSIDTEDEFQASLGANDGSGAENDPYIIRTAEQFAYLSSYAGDNSAGKYYKVADNIGAFDFTSYAKDLTATEVNDAYAVSAWKNKWYNNANSYPFQGTFDGNGAVFYGIDGRAYQTGLFPYVSGATIKNLTVQASRFACTADTGAAAIVGKVNSNTTITITNCVVKNCYITTESTGPALGTMVGKLGNYVIVNISHCIVMNNIVTESTAYPYGGISSGSNYYNSGDYNFSNIITIGNTPFATLPASPAYNSSAVNNAGNYSNVYTDQTVDTATYSESQVKQLTTANMQGENALTNMNLSDSTWVATSGYPELSCNHQFAITQYDETGHTYSCIVTLDGVACDIDSYKEDHNLVVDKATWTGTCECGYSTAVEPSVTSVEKTIATWNGSDKPTTLSDSGMTGSGTVGEPYIIKTAAQLWYVAQAAGAETAGMYYRVDDTIGAFDMQNNTWGLNSNSTYFQGIFDGNGVEIVNFKASGWNIGLFPRIAGNVTIKNIKVANATVTSSGGDAGVIVGSIATTANVTISGCVVINSTVSGKCAAGAIIGTAGAQTLVVENCFVANNTVDANTAEADTQEYKDNAVIGYGHTLTRTLNNTIAIGNDPNVRVSSASKVYTDQASSVSGITQKTVEELKGAGVVAELGFDDAVWFDTDSYPELYVMHEMQIIPVNDSTHKHACGVVLGGVACGLEVSSQHDVTMNGTTATCNDCGHSYEVKGIVVPVEKTTKTWTVTSIQTEDAFLAAVTGSGTDKDPYIIDTPEELCYIVNYAGANSAGKYYKVDDSVGAFNMTSYGVNETAANIQSTLEDKITAWNKWWYNGADNPFQGNFDGNGIVIYGLHGGSWQSGLFPKVSGTVTIKNLTVKASGFKSTGNAGAGAIIGSVAASSVTIENCAVENCYLKSAGSGPIGIMVANLNNNSPLIITNCFVKDNICEASSNYPYGGITSGANYSNATSYQFSNIIAIGNTPFATLPDSPAYYSANVNNATNYTNVYTDQSVDTSVYSESQVKQLTTANMQGANAQANMSLDFDDIWLATSGYPVLRAMHELAVKSNGAAGHTEVCAVVLDSVECELEGLVKSHRLSLNSAGTHNECDCGYSEEFISGIITEIPAVILNRLNNNTLYASSFANSDEFKAAYSADNNPTLDTSDCYMYASSLNLKTNPHIAFTFALMNDYRTDKANVTFTFKAGGETIATVTGDQLINNAGAGRYHLYRFKTLPVTKLCEQVSITASYGGNTTDMGTYSAAGYAINAMNAGSAYVHHANVAMSLVFYSEMLAARYGA